MRAFDRPRSGIETVAAALLVTAPFGPALLEAFRLSHANGVQTYTPLVPVVALYLGWRRHREVTPSTSAHFQGPGMLSVTTPLIAALALVGARLATDPALAAALRIIAWLALLAGLLRFLLGRAGLDRWGPSLLLLLFLAPLPRAGVELAEGFLQHGSALFARLFFEIQGTPVHLRDLTLHLPGMMLQVAPECSGLRSTLVLLLLTAIAAVTLLRGTFARLALIAAVAPIAIARNALRIFVIGELCVRDGPAALDSILHRHGGPAFFALSLVPWTLLLLALGRREAAARHAIPVTSYS